ncbi:MAG: ACP S-malonyltransferase [Coriobacteriales bacterium]|nr:ACP S-malonyltransferase [Coriobacteriales bacterium]
MNKLNNTWPSELFVFRGDTPEAARALMQKVKALYGGNDTLGVRDVAYSLSIYSDEQIHFVIVAGDRDDFLARLDAAINNEDDENVYSLQRIEGKVAFLFPGQGSQRVNMAADLFALFPQMRRLLDEYPLYQWLLFPDAVTDEVQTTQQSTPTGTPSTPVGAPSDITDTRNAQPLLGIVDFAIAELLRDLGVDADMAAGHSYGELPALCFAEALDAGELVDLSRKRAESILAAVGDDPGRMLAVHADINALRGSLEGETEVWAVNFNAPRQTVVAGTSAGVEAFGKKLKTAGLAYSPLKVACAFHSPLLARAEEIFASVLKEVTFSKPTLPVWSNTTAKIYPQTAAAIRDRLAKHLVSPVRFREEAEQMYADGARIFIEAGPGKVLTDLVAKNLSDREIVVIQTERKGVEGLSYLLCSLAKYIATGREINLEKLFEGREAQPLNLDALGVSAR